MMTYQKEDLITVAKRDNNTKRPFLLVNPLQGKHLAVSPSDSLELFQTLARQVFSRKDVDYSHTLVIGFAETATAIGAGLSIYAPFEVSYIQTTRETYEGKEFLYFNEEHSHATDQMVIRDFLDQNLQSGYHILFAEDEVTTGKTIENFIHVLKKTYPEYQLSFGIASILNGMGSEKLEELEKCGIFVDYLLAVPSYDYDTILGKYTYEQTIRHDYTKDSYSSMKFKTSHSYEPLVCSHYADTRLGVSAPDYKEQCLHLARQVMEQLTLLQQDSPLRILILGTEECMYPGISFGAYVEKHTCHQVRFHATTRSPILPDEGNDYPIKERYCLHSFYEQERITYLYNLWDYDICIVVTDSKTETTAMEELCDALQNKISQKIILVNWR